MYKCAYSLLSRYYNIGLKAATDTAVYRNPKLPPGY